VCYALYRVHVASDIRHFPLRESERIPLNLPRRVNPPSANFFIMSHSTHYNTSLYDGHEQASWFPTYSRTTSHIRPPLPMDAASDEDEPQQPIIMQLAYILDNDPIYSPPPSRFRLPSRSPIRRSLSSRKKAAKEPRASERTTKSAIPSTNCSRTDLAPKRLKKSLSFSTVRAGMGSRARSFVSSALSRSMPSRAKMQVYATSSDTLVSTSSLIDEDGVLVHKIGSM
jgi:hypothetical protein